MESSKTLSPVVVAAFALGAVILGTAAFVTLFIAGLHYESAWTIKCALLGLACSYLSQVSGTFYEFSVGDLDDDDNRVAAYHYVALGAMLAAIVLWFVGAISL